MMIDLTNVSNIISELRVDKCYAAVLSCTVCRVLPEQFQMLKLQEVGLLVYWLPF